MPTRLPQAVPEIPVTNVDAAAEYYASVLGFSVDWGNDHGGIGGISQGDCRMFLTNAAFRAARGPHSPVIVWLISGAPWGFEAWSVGRWPVGANKKGPWSRGLARAIAGGCGARPAPSMAPRLRECSPARGGSGLRESAPHRPGRRGGQPMPACAIRATCSTNSPGSPGAIQVQPGIWWRNQVNCRLA